MNKKTGFSMTLILIVILILAFVFAAITISFGNWVITKDNKTITITKPWDFPEGINSTKEFCELHEIGYSEDLPDKCVKIINDCEVKVYNKIKIGDEYYIVPS